MTPFRVSTMILSALGATAATAPSIDAMRWHHRIVLVAAPAPDDATMLQQRHVLTGWRREAAARDIALVGIAGTRVAGVSDPAATLRRRYNLPDDSVQVLLIGKDGHVAIRSRHPITADRLRATIDAMPMREAGER